MDLLMVIDVQNDFITGSLGSEEAVKALPNIINKVKNHKGVIIATMDTHDTDYSMTYEGLKIPTAHCIEYTSGWEIPDILYNMLITKPLYKRIQKRSFALTNFTEEYNNFVDQIIKKSPKDYSIYNFTIDKIEIIGYCTDICVISNALYLRSDCPNIDVIVDSSCCAGTTPENHQKALDIMKGCLIEVI